MSSKVENQVGNLDPLKRRGTGALIAYRQKMAKRRSSRYDTTQTQSKLLLIKEAVIRGLGGLCCSRKLLIRRDRAHSSQRFQSLTVFAILYKNFSARLQIQRIIQWNQRNS